MSQLEIGQAIPAFALNSTAGEFTQAHFLGKITVLYFYPKDNTPGCTTESQNFRDALAQFQQLGAQVIGVSRDTLGSHERFIEKQSLNFPLIADTEEVLCSIFGVIKMKNMYGKQVRGIERSTFIIDAHGALLHQWRGVRVPGHVDQVLSTLATQN